MHWNCNFNVKFHAPPSISKVGASHKQAVLMHADDLFAIIIYRPVLKLIILAHLLHYKDPKCSELDYGSLIGI